MVTRVVIENFKQFEHIEFELNQSVVFIGPNNSGKTTLFQALCLWETGVRKYLESQKLRQLNRTHGVTLNRQALINTPIDSMKLLWRNQQATQGVAPTCSHVPLVISLEGEASFGKWKCTTQFTYNNEESFTCRISEGERSVQKLYNTVNFHFGFLQTMSGISSMEDKLTEGSIARHLGEGKTAEVLRNLCYNMLYPETDSSRHTDSLTSWKQLVQLMNRMFGVQLNKPVYIRETGIINLTFRREGKDYPISSAGRGFQQILLLLTYILSNRSTILLLDEPDAHLEIVRQREIFNSINELAKQNDSQLLIASHSEVILNSASDSATNVIALIEGKAYPVLNGKQDVKYVSESLAKYGWDKYAAARMYGHILFLEGETDLKMLTVLAEKLKHPVAGKLPRANVYFVHGNVPSLAVSTYMSFKTFFPELKGLAVFDKLEKNEFNPKLPIISLTKRELENYFVSPKVLCSFAESLAVEQGVKPAELRSWMQESIADNRTPARLKDLTDPWWSNEKITDNWLDQIFPSFYDKLPHKTNYQNYKKDYWQLVNFVAPSDVSREIVSILDSIDMLISPQQPTENVAME